MAHSSGGGVLEERFGLPSFPNCFTGERQIKGNASASFEKKDLKVLLITKLSVILCPIFTNKILKKTFIKPSVEKRKERIRAIYVQQLQQAEE